MKEGKQKKERDVDKRYIHYKSKHLELEGNLNDQDVKDMMKTDQTHSIIQRYGSLIMSFVIITALIIAEQYIFSPLGALPYALRNLNFKLK